MQFPPASCYFLPLRFKCSPKHPILRHLPRSSPPVSNKWLKLALIWLSPSSHDIHNWTQLLLSCSNSSTMWLLVDDAMKFCEKLRFVFVYFSPILPFKPVFFLLILGYMFTVTPFSSSKNKPSFAFVQFKFLQCADFLTTSKDSVTTEWVVLYCLHHYSPPVPKESIHILFYLCFVVSALIN